MGDFQFLQNPLNKKWMILSPRRAKRPDIARGIEPVCPFCLGREGDEKEAYRVGGEVGDSNWEIRVLHNKFPFAPVHEVIIHSPDHQKNFNQLPKAQVELILQTYRQRYNTHKNKGQVYIFNNHGEKGGESLPHPHTQLAVIPFQVKTDLPVLASSVSVGYAPRPHELDSQKGGIEKEEMAETKDFYIFCPQTSQWPDEVWVAPKKRGRIFGEISDQEIQDLAFVLPRLLQIFDLRHGNEFPFNFYIYPGGDWYLRIIPRVKSLGGFEVGTGIFVNTQDPKETMKFIKANFGHPNEEEIRTIHRAAYHRGV